MKAVNRTAQWVPFCFSKLFRSHDFSKPLFYTPLAHICRMPIHFSQSLEHYKVHTIINSIVCIYSHITLSTMLNIHDTKIVSCTPPMLFFS
jgi:hypothetical protein